MRAVTDSNGQVAIDLRNDDGTLSFKVGGIDGVPFPANREVDIPDDRLNGVIEKVCRPLGFGPEHLVWGSTVT